jgi:predicted GNAT superfamily acetyltransferase
MIRNANIADFPSILKLNLESEHLLAPMNRELLEKLHAQAAYHRVACINGEVVAFILAFREDAESDSQNFKWFAARHHSFLYIDRITVSRVCQRKGLGRDLYRDLFQFAQLSGVNTITCEYYLQPLNEASSRFHAEFGFKEVGEQWVMPIGTAEDSPPRKVSLQEVVIGAS